MPILLTWDGGQAAAITEARVRNFAGAYLERPSVEATTLRCRLSPLPSPGSSVVGRTPHESPWPMIIRSDVAGNLLESNLLLCLNDPQRGDFNWLPARQHGTGGTASLKTTTSCPQTRVSPLTGTKSTSDFCTGITSPIAQFPAMGSHGTGSIRPTTGGPLLTPTSTCRARKCSFQGSSSPRQQGVSIRLWVHWKPLSKRLEEALALYESWGVKASWWSS